MQKAKTVDEFIRNAPKEFQAKLRELRKIIKNTAPKAEEKISYGVAFYEYKGRLVYFGYAKNHIGVYMLPAFLDQYEGEIIKYRKSKSGFQFPIGQKLPLEEIKSAIKAAIKFNDSKTKI